MHGTADTIVPIDLTTALFGRLAEIGFNVELVQVPGVEHAMSRDMDELFHEWLDEAVCEPSRRCRRSSRGARACCRSARAAAGAAKERRSERRRGRRRGGE